MKFYFCRQYGFLVKQGKDKLKLKGPGCNFDPQYTACYLT